MFICSSGFAANAVELKVDQHAELNSDHLPIEIDILCSSNSCTIHETFNTEYNFKKADWPAFRAILDDLSLLFQNNHFRYHLSFDELNKLIADSLNIDAPNIVFRRSSTNSWPKEILDAIAVRHKKSKSRETKNSLR